MNDELEDITSWFKNIKFNKKLIGGVDEADVFKKLQELQNLYQNSFIKQKDKYEILLKDRDDLIDKLRQK